MAISDIFHIGRWKQELAAAQAELATLKLRLSDTLVLTDIQLRERISQLRDEASAIENGISSAKQELEGVRHQVQTKRSEVVELDDTLLLQEFSLYQPKHKLTTSAAYKLRLDAIRDQQANLVRFKTAATCATNWSLNGNEREGQRMITDYTKLIVRAFNNECDVTIEGVKFSNLDSCTKRIRKSCEMLNKLGARMSIAITAEYLRLKLDELDLFYEYQMKKQEEKEQLKKERERQREAAKVAREIEERRQTLLKEEKHFTRAKTDLMNRLLKADSDTERQLCENEISSIDVKLAEVSTQQKEVDYREANASAGYVYIISNIGAFGEGVFKIGVTRRLDPQERIDELSDASVPFDFDVHALVFSDDAYALETELHKHFDNLRINRMNMRKEFFRASVDDLEAVLLNNFKKPVDFLKLAEAAEYRQTLKLIEALVSPAT
jgi:hypothetical protein